LADDGMYLTSKSRIQVAEWRADYVLRKLFGILATESKAGVSLLPEDYSAQARAYGASPAPASGTDPDGINQGPILTQNDRMQRRIICDFIAGMTERYALEFYGRLFSEAPETLFKPL